MLVRDLWYESGAGPGFASVHGAATFTLDGARISSPVDAVPPAFDINGLNGSATILGAHIDDRIVVSGDGANARVLALGVVAERNASNYFLHRAMPPARAFLLNSRQRRVGGPGNRSVPTANSDGVDAAFIRAQLAQTRGEMPAPLTDLPAGVSDFRVFRVWVSGGLANLTLRP